MRLEWFYPPREIVLDMNRAFQAAPSRFNGLSIPFSLFSQIEYISYVQAQDDTAAKWTLYKHPRSERRVASITLRSLAPNGCQGLLSTAWKANTVSR